MTHLKRLIVAAFIFASCVFSAPQAKAQMHCWPGENVWLPNGIPFCVMGGNGGCEWCEITPPCDTP